MKKIASLILVATLGTATVSLAQSFEGVVNYNVSADGGDQQMASAMQGASMQIYFGGGGKVKTVFTMSFGTTTAIADKDTSYSFSDMMGNKREFKIAISDANKMHQGKTPDIQYSDDTKQIAGYTCKKAVITSTSAKGQPISTTVYYTDQLPSYEGKMQEYKGLKGFPLEFTTNEHGKSITFTATQVAKKTLPADTFTLPTGYTVVPMGGGSPYGHGGGM